MKLKKYLSIIFIITIIFSLTFCNTPDDSDTISTTPYADQVIEAPGQTGSGFLDSKRAANGVRGAGCSAGGIDVFSLDYGGGNYITLRWKERIIKNGTGTDFVVFENAFDVTSSGERFMDHIIVSVSRNNIDWVDFPYDYTRSDESIYDKDPSLWQGFAGKTPVLYHEENNRVDPFDQSAAGGDHFDLDNLPDSQEGLEIKNNGFTYIKLTTAPSIINPGTGSKFVHEVISNGADIDGVYAKYIENE